MTDQITKIAISKIDPNPDQPRKAFEGIADLAASIKTEGLAQPITVRPIGKRFEIVMGERRWRAFRHLVSLGETAFSSIPAHVKVMDDRKRDILALVENHQRQDIQPLEEARAFKRLVDQGMTPEEIGEAIGSPAFKVRWRLQLLNLNAEATKLVESGQLDRQQALEISRLPDHASQTRMIQLVNRGSLTGWGALRAAVDQSLGLGETVDIFGPEAPQATAADVQKLRGMESKIESVARSLAGGWKDGECIIATRVNPDAATRLAETIAAVRTTLAHMERQLRTTAAQGHMAAAPSLLEVA